MPEIVPIARIFTPYPGKFGIPRQPGLVQNESRIIFEKPFRDNNAVRGLTAFSHIWLIWEFSENRRDGFTPTVRPPRLGGNERVGVFATRSSFRPNSLALSAVRLLRVETDCPDAPVLVVQGADMLSGTPIYDIKPYLPFADCIPDAVGGFADALTANDVAVRFACDTVGLSAALLSELSSILSQDPRPHYQTDPTREYAFEYGGYHVVFTGKEKEILVKKIEPASQNADTR